MSLPIYPEKELDRVRRHTSPETLKKIEERLEHNIRFYSAQPDRVLAGRLEELKREWSIERWLQVNVSSLGFTTALLALVGRKKWALLTCGILGLFLCHGIRGYDLPTVLLRRIGVRTRGEIDREIFALKALRGDFKDLPQDFPAGDGFPARHVLDAVNA